MPLNASGQTVTVISGALTSHSNAHARSTLAPGLSGACSRVRVIETKRQRSAGDERASDADAGVSPQTNAAPSASAPINRRADRNPILLLVIATPRVRLA